MTEETVLQVIRRQVASRELEQHFLGAGSWQFAHILQDALGRGSIYMSEKDHFVLLVSLSDIGDALYDASGRVTKYRSLIPEVALKNHLNYYKGLSTHYVLTRDAYAHLQTVWRC